MAEAITRLKLDAFQDWLQSNGKYQVYESAVNADEVKVLDVSRNSDSMKSCVECLQEQFNLYDKFEKSTSDSERFLMSVFWNLYLDMVQTQRFHQVYQIRRVGPAHPLFRENAPLVSCL